MTRHPTTQQIRNTLAALIATGGTVTTPLSAKEQAVKDQRGHGKQVTHFDARRVGGLEERMVPIMGHGPGAIPGSRPGDNLR